ncbi:uncharacterized protein K441DRAFT_377696 [Cenococcum geophilum 1.58]|uniref:Uncharacterized protein n=1 Tax=Cenococcum geophilum 1.58 TaxID=794803 RepID=A0ACC8EL31_9PEZI|nr:hypothetical protein K441DRAFT_377696 [Cenococcum geophilum 1.58]
MPPSLPLSPNLIPIPLSALYIPRCCFLYPSFPLLLLILTPTFTTYSHTTPRGNIRPWLLAVIRC